MLPDTLYENSFDLIFRGRGEPVGQLEAGSQACPHICHQALPQVLRVLRGGHGDETARFDVGRAGFACLLDRVFFGPSVLDQAHDRFLQERSRADGTALGHLTFYDALELVS
jgi:hypothetical protein